ncbi:YgjV family protein [Photobacterium damselae]|uniref:YgjV family protein n=1 Tax=Photobacterium damselae TaxID=38293 RepID=UPI0023EB58BE|nr:YgjV family protein [Photobacterium damselae]
MHNRYFLYLFHYLTLEIISMEISLLGYVASALIILSLIMKNIKTLRYVNLAGCSLYAVYGLIIQAWPVFAMNFICVGINLYRIYTLNKQEQ